MNVIILLVQMMDLRPAEVNSLQRATPVRGVAWVSSRPEFPPKPISSPLCVCLNYWTSGRLSIKCKAFVTLVFVCFFFK